MKTNQKIDYIVLLRAIAIILVVLGHATRSINTPNTHMYSPSVTPYWEMLIKSYIYSFHMPLFFWISGYVFFYSSIEKVKQTSIKNQFYKKVKRLIVPLYSTSFFILLPTIYFFGHLDGSLLYQVKEFLLASNNDHLWFLSCLFCIFLFAIPMKNILNTDKKWILLLVLFAWIALFNSRIPFFGNAIKYSPFFVFGFLVRKIETKIDRLHSLLCFFITWLLHFALFSLNKSSLGVLTVPIWYLEAFLGICFMYFITKYTTRYFEHSSSIWNGIKIIDEDSYSIYLFHVTFLYIVLYALHSLGVQSSLLRVVLSFATGMFFPIVMHALFSRSIILSYLFGIRAKAYTKNLVLS